MCGRFTQRLSWRELHELMDLIGAPLNLRPRYNVAPSQDVAVVRTAEGGRRLSMLRWGLIPAWAKDHAIGHKLINARSETAAEKPSFCSAFRRYRCLIPADGFYEWRRRGGTPPALAVRPAGRRTLRLRRSVGALDRSRGRRSHRIARRARPRRRGRDLYDPYHRRQRDRGTGARPHAGHPAAGRLGRLARGRGGSARSVPGGGHDGPSGLYARQPARQRRPALRGAGLAGLSFRRRAARASPSRRTPFRNGPAVRSRAAAFLAAWWRASRRRRSGRAAQDVLRRAASPPEPFAFPGPIRGHNGALQAEIRSRSLREDMLLASARFERSALRLRCTQGRPGQPHNSPTIRRRRSTCSTVAGTRGASVRRPEGEERNPRGV